MTKKEYMAQRKELLDQAQAFIDEGKIDESTEKMKAVEELDEKWEAIKLANANMNALKEKTKGIDLSNHSVPVEGGEVIDQLVDTKPKDEEKAYVNAWAKTMQGRKLTAEESKVFAAKNEKLENVFTHDTGNTGILIPESVTAGIWKRAKEEYPFLDDVKGLNVSGKLTMTKGKGAKSGNEDWYDEDTETGDDEEQFAQVNLTGCELSKAVTISWKLRSMAIDEFVDYIEEQLGERVGAAMGTAMYKGKGKPGEGDTFKEEPLGVETAMLAEEGTPQVLTYDPEAATPVPLTYKKMTSLVALLHSSYVKGACFYANNNTIWNELANIVDGVGRPMFVADTTQGGVGRILGFVVKSDAGCTEGTIVFGNPKKGYLVNTNEPMGIETEDHVKKRNTDYVAYTIVDGAPIDEKAFAMIRNLPEA